MKTIDLCRICGKSIPPAIPGDNYCVSCRYDNPPNVRAWDDDDDAPPPPEPVYVEPEMDDPADPAREALGHALAGLLKILTGKNSALQAGQAAHVLAFLVGVSEHRSKASLAKQLKVSPGRITQILAEIPQEFERLGFMKRRSAKGRTVLEQENLWM